MSARESGPHVGRIDVEALDGGELASQKLASRESPPGFVHLSHNGIGEPAWNIMQVARLNTVARSTLSTLANCGYHLYLAAGGESRLVHESRLRGFWRKAVDGVYTLDNRGVVHAFEPASSGQIDRLVVVMSPMAANPFETSLNRYFQPSYGSLMKHLPPNTGVLRLGDVGSVKDAFYLDTTYKPRNATVIAEFLSEFAAELGVTRRNVVLYGASKGGTGALYHSLIGGWHSVSVDPIVGDKYYEEKHNDLHFTGSGLFPNTKEEAFSAAVKQAKASASGDCQRIIVTSDRSPQKVTIDDCVRPLGSALTVLNSTNPAIVSHPTVARNTLWAHLMLINNVLMGFSYPAGEHIIP